MAAVALPDPVDAAGLRPPAAAAAAAAAAAPPPPPPPPSPPPTRRLAAAVAQAFRALQQRRQALGLGSPGTVDGIAREVQRDVLLTHQTFAGLRAELTKSFSVAPLFQISHAFASGSPFQSPYTFLALYGTNSLLCQAQLDSDASLSARLNYRLAARLVHKASVQIQPASALSPAGAQLSLEHDYAGDDFSASLKAINPSVLDGPLTGTLIASYLQSVTPRLSLGLEGVWQRPAGGLGPEAALSYAARYRADDWIASAQLLTQGGLQMSYWRRLMDKVDTGVDVNLQFAGLAAATAMTAAAPPDGVATLGAKYEFSRSIFRAQLDTQGKLACLLEKVVAPPVRVTFAGELDHAKNTAKLGLAVSIDASGEELLEQQDKIQPASPPS